MQSRLPHGCVIPSLPQNSWFEVYHQTAGLRHGRSMALAANQSRNRQRCCSSSSSLPIQFGSRSKVASLLSRATLPYTTGSQDQTFRASNSNFQLQLPEARIWQFKSVLSKHLQALWDRALNLAPRSEFCKLAGSGTCPALGYECLQAGSSEFKVRLTTLSHREQCTERPEASVFWAPVRGLEGSSHKLRDFLAPTSVGNHLGSSIVDIKPSQNPTSRSRSKSQ